MIIAGTAMESDLSTHFCKMSGLQSKKDTCDELTWKAGKGPLPSTPKSGERGTQRYLHSGSVRDGRVAGPSGVQRHMSTNKIRYSTPWNIMQP